jgi:hypothetical protein
MPFKSFFKKKSDEPEFDPLRDLVLGKLKVGYLLDYDMKTWSVTEFNKYDIEGHEKLEWELTSSQEVLYLEREEDDEVYWSISKKIPIGKIEGGVRKYIIENEDPPEQITLENKTYYMDESGAGFFYKNGLGRGIEFIFWSFMDDDEKNFVSIEQWGETEFEAAMGKEVEEYQFSNILPGGDQVS